MNLYTHILQQTDIGKTAFSNVSVCVYDAFWAKTNRESEIDLAEIQLLLSLLEEQSKVVVYLLYNNKIKADNEISEAMTFLSKVAQLKEDFKLAQGLTSLEEIETAAKTLAPKMQSSFG